MLLFARAWTSDGRVEFDPSGRAPPADRSETILDVAVENDAAPWSQRDGTGYANDLVRAAFRAVGMEVHFQVVPYARCKRMALEGQIAACLSMSHASELAGAVIFPEQPLFRCHSEAVLRVDDERAPASLADLPAGSLVGVVLGYEYPEALYRLERAGTIKLDSSRSEELSLRKLAEKRIDVAVVNVNDIKDLSFTSSKAGVMKRVRHAFWIGDLASYIGFSRMHARGPSAGLRFSEGLAKIEQSGEKAQIDELWAARMRAEAAAAASQAAPTPETAKR